MDKQRLNTLAKVVQNLPLTFWDSLSLCATQLAIPKIVVTTRNTIPWKILERISGLSTKQTRPSSPRKRAPTIRKYQLVRYLGTCILRSQLLLVC